MAALGYRGSLSWEYHRRKVRQGHFHRAPSFSDLKNAKEFVDYIQNMSPNHDTFLILSSYPIPFDSRNMFFTHIEYGLLGKSERSGMRANKFHGHRTFLSTHQVSLCMRK